MTERQIQLAILTTIRSSIVVAAPNYTPRHWWECDVWAVTRSGYATEYEIKVSESDFRADARKDALRIVNGAWESKNKHRSIGDVRGPSRFYYVVPADLTSLESEIPEWAGFAVAPRCPYTNRPRCIKIHKQAPKLHGHKTTRREIHLAQTRMWHRYWECLRTIDRQQIDIEKLSRFTDTLRPRGAGED